jgi:ATP-binding cassette subfamily B protein
VNEQKLKTRRRWLVPEVVQTSAMDCGPASLKCLLEGYGVHVSYGRLREACQTDVDGTSIDSLEEVAVQLGFHADQVMLPVDHLLLEEVGALPAIVVVHRPDGSTHFVVLWRRHGPFVQIMDPVAGRRWLTVERFLADIYVHSMAVPAEEWRAWAHSERFTGLQRRRMRNLAIRHDTLLAHSLADPDWRPIARLDAALRMTEALVRSGGLRRGTQAERALKHAYQHEESIPRHYWSVSLSSAGENHVTMSGAVLIHVRGLATGAASPASAELSAALAEKPVSPAVELLSLLRADGMLVPAVLLSALALATAGVVTEAVLLRGFFDLARELGLAGQRMAAVAALITFFLGMLALEWPLAANLLRQGRRLEIRLRQAFLEKIPRLGDRYFQSRAKSDMADRSHIIHKIRHLPELGSQLVRGVFELALTAAAIAWIDPAGTPLAIAAAGIGVALPLITQRAIRERDLRFRTHGAALSGFYLDGLLGLVPIRTHGAERAVRRQHGRLLGEWARAGLGVQRVALWVQAVQLAAGYGLAAWLLFDHLARRGEAGGALLLVYWALNLPVIGEQIGLAAWQYPAFRNITLRLLEPLGALEGQGASAPAPFGESRQVALGVSIRLENVSVVAAGHTILEDVTLSIPSGSHVAIVGPSGAGKSSLMGLLLGWHRPAKGRLLVDGATLEGGAEDFAELRRRTAWIDPAVQLWNRSMYENLRYGTRYNSAQAMTEVIEAAGLRNVLEKLPHGLETRLGEGGALVSGGEGQRVRLGRAMLRSDVRLAILDEPFRGLDYEQRRDLLEAARRLWAQATLFCVTHDVASTRMFERVLVIENGCVVEDGSPAHLAAQPDSRYSAMLAQEMTARSVLWSGGLWRRLRLENGKVGAA